MKKKTNKEVIDYLMKKKKSELTKKDIKILEGYRKEQEEARSKIIIIKEKAKELKKKEKREKAEAMTEAIRQKIKVFNPLTYGSAFNLKKLWKKLLNKLMPEAKYLINMELRNGMHEIFFVFTQKNKFEHRGGEYIIDDEMKYWVTGLNVFAFDFHQDICMPIKRKIPVSDIRTAVNSAGITDVETALNPACLKQFITSEVIQQVMKGQELAEQLKRLTVISFIGMLGTLILLIIFMFKTGMLDAVTGMF